MAAFLLMRTARLSCNSVRPLLLSKTVSPLYPALSCTVHSTTPKYKAAIIGKESKHWEAERVLSIALLGVVPLAVFYPGPVVDWGVTALLPLHNYWGVQQVITDYVHGPTLPKLVHSAWAGVSVLTLIGLAYFNYADVGICKAVAALWAL